MSEAVSILLVDDYPGRTVGGGEQHLLRMAHACREWGYRVGVVCTPDSGLEIAARSSGYEVWPIRMRRSPVVGPRRLARLFEAVSPDIVHAHGFHATLVASPAAKRAGVPVVLSTVHSMPSASLDLRPGPSGIAENVLRTILYRRAAPSVDCFVCVVEAARRDLVRMGIDESKTVVIRNGIPDPAAAASRLAELHGDDVIVGSIGRLELPKDYASFVDAAAIVLAKRASVRFRLVGEGSLRGSLERRVEALGLCDQFEFVGWSDSPLGEIAAMDIYAVSSVTDTTNLGVLEAMGLGRPVVATDVGGISDAVVDGVSGRLVPRRRPDLLAAAILELAGNAELRKSMGRAGRQGYEGMFSEARMVDAYRALYSDMLRR